MTDYEITKEPSNYSKFCGNAIVKTCLVLFGILGIAAPAVYFTLFYNKDSQNLVVCD